MNQLKLKVADNIKIAKDVYKMKLAGPVKGIFSAGQFINLKVDGLFLRRPISVCDWNDKSVTIIYKVVGQGTEEMSKMACGTVLDVLAGLGNGYNIEKSGNSPLLIGGGVGVPPLFGLCKSIISIGKKTSVILGFNTKNEIFLEREFKDLGADVFVATVDGSYGVKGYAADLMKELDYTYFYTCGPIPMLKAVYNASNGSGEFSFEERMGCGFGACMGCTCKTKYGSKRICTDGPVLTKEEIVW